MKASHLAGSIFACSAWISILLVSVDSLLIKPFFINPSDCCPPITAAKTPLEERASCRAHTLLPMLASAVSCTHDARVFAYAAPHRLTGAEEGATSFSPLASPHTLLCFHSPASTRGRQAQPEFRVHTAGLSQAGSAPCQV